MAIRLEFFSRIRMLFLDFSESEKFAPLNRPQNFEVEILPSSTPVVRRPTHFASCEVENTRSNLG